jgi:hypothetical protein
MPYFVRPNGEMHAIVVYQPDDKTRKVLVGLENGLSRWFGFDEIHVINGEYLILQSSRNLLIQ